MKQVDRYLLRRLLSPVLVILLGLTVLYDCFMASAGMASVMTGELQSDQFWLYLIVRNAIAMEVLLPTACFLGMVVGVSQLHRDGEAFVLYGSGVSPVRLGVTSAIIAVVLGILVALLALFGRPWAYEISDGLTNEINYTLKQLPSGEFYRIGKNMVIRHKRMRNDADTIERVFVWRLIEDTTEVIQSDAARVFEDEQQQRWLQLDYGVQYRLEANKSDRILEFERLSHLFEGYSRGPTQQRRNARPTAMLTTSTVKKDIAELQWRVCLPIIALFLPILAFRIGYQLPGHAGYGRIWLAIAVYIVIYTVFSALRTAVENDQMSALPGMYLMPLIMLGVYGIVARLVRYR